VEEYGVPEMPLRSPVAVFYDGGLDDACVPTKTNAGLRCLPVDVDSGFDFSDPQCTKPMYREFITAAECAATRPRYIVSPASPLIPPYDVMRAYRIGAAFTPQGYYTPSGTVCSGHAISSPDPNVTYFDTTPIPDSELAGLTPVTE
jgi:hypothetical protein